MRKIKKEQIEEKLVFIPTNASKPQGEIDVATDVGLKVKVRLKRNWKKIFTDKLRFLLKRK